MMITSKPDCHPAHGNCKAEPEPAPRCCSRPNKPLDDHHVDEHLDDDDDDLGNDDDDNDGDDKQTTGNLRFFEKCNNAQCVHWAVR